MKVKDRRKPETIIAELRRWERAARDERDQAQIERDQYRARATKAEQEAAAANRRLDALIAAIPELRHLPAFTKEQA